MYNSSQGINVQGRDKEKSRNILKAVTAEYMLHKT